MSRPTVSALVALVSVFVLASAALAVPAAPSPGASKTAAPEAAAPKTVAWPKEVMVQLPTDPAERRKKVAELRRAYARTVRTVASVPRSRPGLDFQRTSVKNVLLYLAEIGNFSVIFDRELEEQGIDLESRTVTLKVSGITYEKAIELVLPRECGYRVGPGYVLITTMEKAWLPLKTASYSIRLHLAKIPNFTDAPRFEVGDVTQAAAQAAGGGGGAFGDLFGAGGGMTEEEDRVTPEQIIDLVKRFVRHDNDRRIAPWDDEGGPASIQYLDGRLIVNQTDAGHRAVRRLLTMLE